MFLNQITYPAFKKIKNCNQNFETNVRMKHISQHYSENMALKAAHFYYVYSHTVSLCEWFGILHIMQCHSDTHCHFSVKSIYTHIQPAKPIQHTLKQIWATEGSQCTSEIYHRNTWCNPLSLFLWLSLSLALHSVPPFAPSVSCW